MAVTIKFDNRKFNETLRRCVAASGRTAEKVVNTHAYFVAAGAAHACKVSSRDRIKHVMERVVGIKVKIMKARAGRAGRIVKERAARVIKSGKNKGKVIAYRAAREIRGRASRAASVTQRGNLINEQSFAARIVNARIRDFAGADYMLWGDALIKRAEKLIKAKMASVGFIASGFVRAARQLRKFATHKTRETPKGIKVIPGGKGGKGEPARAGRGVFGSGHFIARISNDVVESGGKWQAKGRTFNPRPIAEVALQSAMQTEQLQMEKRLRAGMTDAMRKAGALP